MLDDFLIKAEEIKAVINRSDRILLHFHPSPDGDSVGSALAMFHYLVSQNKSVTLIKGDSDLPLDFSVLPGFNQVVVKDFSAVNQTDYDLFLILDSASPDRISRLSPVEFADHLETVVIDHHISNSGFGQINLIDSSAAATAQILFWLFEAWQVEITPEIAICLFIGLYGDTGGFKFPNTTPGILEIATKLTYQYPDFPQVLEQINSNHHPNWLHFQALALSSLSIHGQLAISTISYEEIASRNFSRETLGDQDIANLLISVKDWPVGISIFEKEAKETGISLRSREPDNFDVSKIAKALGGGGHQAAAGAGSPKPALAVKAEVLKTIEQIYPELIRL